MNKMEGEKSRKMKVKDLRKQAKGITLIALVITIIVLLILAAVSIATLTGQNGILTQANSAKEQTEIASVKEQAQMDIANWTAERLRNGESTELNDETVKSIIETANAQNTNPYYKELQNDRIITPSGYEIPFEELYTNNSTGGGTTEISVANYGDRVNYVSKGDSSLIWRIFYDDEDYVYLISSKTDGSNTVESYNFMDFTEILMNYSGSTDITDTFLQSLNSKWFEKLEGGSNQGSAIITAYLMDQSVWDEYKDNEGKTRYAIGGPTLEVFINSYNKSQKTEREVTVSGSGYATDPSVYSISTVCNGIYNNGTNWWIVSPAYGGMDDYGGHMMCMFGNLNGMQPATISEEHGLRPMVIIPKANFTYQIIEENE